MPIRGIERYAELAELLRAGPGPELSPDEWVDAHTHIGQHDPDGVKGTPQELLEGLDMAGHGGAVVFPMHEPDGYPPANDAAAAAAAASDGRLRWLCRVDPDAPGAVEELDRCLKLGAQGLKLHPRSDDFGLPHPVVSKLADRCAVDRRPMLFHAGRGIPNLGEGAVELARAHPGMPVILAHAAISDLGLLGSAAAELTNLYFDTSWWMVSDMLQLLTTVPPARILYASDMPYGPGLFTAFLVRRCWAQVGLSDDVLRSIAGAQLNRILDGEDPIDLGPPPGEAAIGERVVRCERIAVHGSTAAMAALRGMPPAEVMGLARLGCQHEGGHPHAALLDACDALLARGLDVAAEDGAEAFDPAPWALVAATCAGTPAVGAPLRV